MRAFLNVQSDKLIAEIMGVVDNLQRINMQIPLCAKYKEKTK